jgi:S-formylglutathione hydrolase FrmB
MRSPRITCRVAVAVAVAVAVPVLGVGVGVDGSAATAHAALREVGERRLDGRLIELTLRTDALSAATRVRVVLPSGYARSPRRRYPVLYLLHGALDDETSWTRQGDAERLTAPYGVIVVMPDSGATGGYANWYNNGRGGPPRWETYHVDELLPFIDRRFRTLGRRSGRAVAGLSMGGFGAMSYAARHPDLFAAAASFSGAVDTNNPLDIAVTPASVFGSRGTQEIRWRGHNPWHLAANLRGMTLIVRTGNGQPGGPFGGGDVVEQVVHQMSVSLHQRLQRLAIPHVWDDYGPGGHSWPYWQRDLRRTLPEFMKVFSHPRRRPAATTFTAVESTYDIDGWRVALRRHRLAFSALSHAGRGGFELRTSGRATVTTPAQSFTPRGRYTIIVAGAVAGAGGRPVLRRADGRGRIAVTIDLGATTRQVRVAIRRAASGPARSKSGTIG